MCDLSESLQECLQSLGAPEDHPGAHAMSLPGVLLEVDQAGEGLEAEVALQVYWH